MDFIEMLSDPKDLRTLSLVNESVEYIVNKVRKQQKQIQKVLIEYVLDRKFKSQEEYYEFISNQVYLIYYQATPITKFRACAIIDGQEYFLYNQTEIKIQMNQDQIFLDWEIDFNDHASAKILETL
jgi:hypothetical protein